MLDALPPVTGMRPLYSVVTEGRGSGRAAERGRGSWRGACWMGQRCEVPEEMQSTWETLMC